MSEQLNDRVRQLVARSGLNQTQFAEAIGIDGPKLTKSLSGTRRFTSLELALIADRGRESVDWLLTGRNTTRALAHRAAEHAVADGDKIGSDTVGLIADRVEGLKVIGRPLELAALPTASRAPLNIERGRVTAEAYVDALACDIHALSTPKLIDKIEETFSVHVVITELPDGCDGMAYANDDVRVIVLAATSAAPYRQRFTLAHELGHIAFGDASDFPAGETMFAAKNNAEMRANTFAAHFIVPVSEVNSVIKTSGAASVSAVFDQLVLDFQMSPKALSYHLKNTGLIDSSQQLALALTGANGAAMRSGRAAEHAERVEASGRTRAAKQLVAAYLGAYADGETTLKPAATLLGWTMERTEQTFGEGASSDDLRPGVLDAL